MSTFKDFLVWYNNLDVVPFLEAVQKMSAFWWERPTCLKTISVPALTLKYLFSFLDEQTYFSLFDQANSDLYHLIKDNNTGGPSIIFHCYHEAAKTKIREAEKGQDADREIWCYCFVPLGYYAEYASGKSHTMPGRKRLETEIFCKDGDWVARMGSS